MPTTSAPPTIRAMKTTNLTPDYSFSESLRGMLFPRSNRPLSLLHHDLIAHFRQRFLANAFNGQQLIRAGETTLATTEIDDRLGRFRTNPVQRFQFGHIGSLG